MTVLGAPAPGPVSRIARLQAALLERRLDYAFIFQNRDLFYFTGTMQDGVLMVPASGEPTLLVRRNYQRARQESPLALVREMESLDELPPATPSWEHGAAGIEADVLPVFLYQRLLSLFPGRRLVDISDTVLRLRRVKEPEEVALLRQSARINDAVHRRVREVLREGMTELELFAELEYTARKLGDDRMASSRGFNTLPPTQIGSGQETAVPNRAALAFGGVGLSPASPCGPSSRPIGRGEVVVVDWVTSYQGYLVDQTRTYFLGEPDPELVKAYHTCREIYRAVVHAIKPGAVCRELYQMAVEMASRAGYPEFGGVGKYRVKFVGHGVGLELTELPVLSYREETRLASGMVLTVEPKIALPGKGLVGVENTLLVTDSAAQPLSGAEAEAVFL